ncbi:RNA polymerase sigma-70 factor (ECF subfamily) [Mucilaginibacter frigoritolerans]|uniref:RNA polymerase sigma-70 factor (ECF subfamily) n=1 Tax=Mucilaginibacter frigoritolerans TaxID=652788 RepID=A0A562TWD3_9SPHI|nr:RNA polymerase sigma-70 factor [Mucilaginibacter frigoritolerans]TWI97618.1 RNA polymerase sigma-70 factor (ECF subfamily) [Mucilaginibacter frigoritolerans]HWZ03013.1 RNA polymerase sigma-70 factor [Mucilaginibacter sp.]
MGTLRTLPDHELIDLLKSGEHAAFIEIYERYWTVLYLHARKILRNEAEAEDVVQEIFSSLWLKKEDIVLKSSLSSYLYSAIRYRIFNQIEHKKVISDYLKSLQQFIKEGEFVTEELYREKELAELIEKEIQALPSKMRQIFELSRKQYLSYKEIAEELEISEHTVKSQVSNALRILKLKLGVSAGAILFLLHHL